MSQVKKTYELEESDLALNYEIVECPACGGSGSTQDRVDYGDWEPYECDECGGTGELAIYKSRDRDL